jgi:hypothetical protein
LALTRTSRSTCQRIVYLQTSRELLFVSGNGADDCETTALDSR